MKVCRGVMALNITSTAYYLILQFQPFQKWPTFKLLRWVLLLNRSVDLNEILCRGCDDAAMGEGEQFGRLPLSCRKKFRHTTKYLTKSP
jgi:hypothetical protein